MLYIDPKGIYIMSIMNELTETIGEQAAIKLGQCLGGARVYIPRVIGNSHLITLAVGQESARAC